MEIRPATAEDWPRLWPFIREVIAAGDTFCYDPVMGEAEARAMWLVPRPGRAVVAAAAGGTLPGTANMYANRPGPGAHVASGNLMVAAEHRGRGVGRRLLEDMLAWARAAASVASSSTPSPPRTPPPSASTSPPGSPCRAPCPEGSAIRSRATSGCT